MVARQSRALNGHVWATLHHGACHVTAWCIDGPYWRTSVHENGPWTHCPPRGYRIIVVRIKSVSDVLRKSCFWRRRRNRLVRSVLRRTGILKTHTFMHSTINNHNCVKTNSAVTRWKVLRESTNPRENVFVANTWQHLPHLLFCGPLVSNFPTEQFCK